MSQAKQEIRLLSARDGIKNAPCFMCLKQSHPDAFTRPRAGLCCSSEQIGKQHKRSAGEVPTGCHNTLVCRRTSAARSPCLISLRSPLLFSLSLSLPPALTSLLSLAHFAVCVTYFLSFFHSRPLALTISVFQPSGLSFVPSWACLSLCQTSASSFAFKYVSWLLALQQR